MNPDRLSIEFFQKDVLEVAPKLLGKKLYRSYGNKINSYTITEVEAYRGEEDLACHASKGKTQRTKIMYNSGGILYIYLIYGIYWMLNIVTGPKDSPQAVLIRGLREVSGPGRLTRILGLDKSFNGEDICSSDRIWIEECSEDLSYLTGPRIGIDYASDFWKNIPWRFYLP